MPKLFASKNTLQLARSVSCRRKEMQHKNYFALDGSSRCIEPDVPVKYSFPLRSAWEFLTAEQLFNIQPPYFLHLCVPFLSFSLSPSSVQFLSCCFVPSLFFVLYFCANVCLLLVYFEYYGSGFLLLLFFHSPCAIFITFQYYFCCFGFTDISTSLFFSRSIKMKCQFMY